jgi:tetratricopeptide (TPR) repeat protein
VKYHPVLLLFTALLVSAVAAEASDQKPLTCTEITSWLIGGVSKTRLSNLVEQRGAGFIPSGVSGATLKAAGSDSTLLNTIRKKQTGDALGSACAAGLAEAAQSFQEKKYEQAEQQIRSLLTRDANNAALHFALGSVLRHREKWDDAADEFTESARLMPGFPETHSRLSYLFYRSEDPDNAIAEARTALSMDPHNTEAYKYLGLALTIDGQYDAAIHAFREALSNDPENPEIYYYMGLALQDKGDLSGSAIYYRKALHLRPAYWEAHSNLGLVLHEQRQFDEAIAEYQAAKRLAPEKTNCTDWIRTGRQVTVAWPKR